MNFKQNMHLCVECFVRHEDNNIILYNLLKDFCNSFQYWLIQYSYILLKFFFFLDWFMLLSHILKK